MTRLTSDDVSVIGETIKGYDDFLRARVGVSSLGMAEFFAGNKEICKALSKSSAAVVPITSGLGVINGFTEAVQAILKHIGIEAFITNGTDVAGFYEAFVKGVNLIFAADDNVFSAFNLKTGKAVDNSFATGRAYAMALELAAKSLKGKTVTVVGAGQVGASAIDYLISKNAKVIVVEINEEKVKRLKKKYKTVSSMNDLSDAVEQTSLVLIAAPADGVLTEKMIKPEMIVSSPAIPVGLTESAMRKLPEDNLIHDPLQLGVISMAALALK
jgi:pyrrolysine biosynthesis protein PylD